MISISSLGYSQCIDDAANLSWPCGWNPSVCTNCCTSSSNGTSDFYFYCGSAPNNECIIYITCSSPSPSATIPVSISTCAFANTFSINVPNGGYTSLNELSVMQTNSVPCGSFGTNLFMRVGAPYNEGATYNFNCL